VSAGGVQDLSQRQAERRRTKREVMTTVLFACTHNAGRSQMAAAFFNRLADPMKARALSAGTSPAAQVHPVVVEAMRELGFDVSSAKPRLLTAELAQTANLLVTMGCGEECPYVSGIEVQDWELQDPQDQPVEWSAKSAMTFGAVWPH
jgi:arsenate reductase (thioredoxin)